MHTRPILPNDWWRTALFSVIMLMMASASNATMDTLSFRYSQSVFAEMPATWQHWLNPAVSWPNKWKNGDRTQGEAFPLSSTALVCTTDAWHLLKSIMLGCLFLAIMAPFRKLRPAPWWVWVSILVGASMLWGLVFESLFRSGF